MEAASIFSQLWGRLKTHAHTAAETGTHKMRKIPNVEAVVNVNRARGSTWCDSLKSAWLFKNVFIFEFFFIFFPPS